MHMPQPHHDQQKIKRKEVHSSQVPPRKPVHRRGQSTTFDEILGLSPQNVDSNGNGNGGGHAQYASPYDNQQGMMVVEAPIDSEPEESDEDVPAAHEEQRHEPAEVHHSPEERPAPSDLLIEVDNKESGSSNGSAHANDSHSGSLHEQPTTLSRHESNVASEKSGRESPALEDDEEESHDDTQWGTLAESVISAFLEGEDGQATGEHGSSEAHDEHGEHDKGLEAPLASPEKEHNEDEADVPASTFDKERPSIST